MVVHSSRIYQQAVDENIGDYCMLNAIPATGWIVKKNSRVITIDYFFFHYFYWVYSIITQSTDNRGGSTMTFSDSHLHVYIYHEFNNCLG